MRVPGGFPGADAGSDGPFDAPSISIPTGRNPDYAPGNCGRLRLDFRTRQRGHRYCWAGRTSRSNPRTSSVERGRTISFPPVVRNASPRGLRGTGSARTRGLVAVRCEQEYLDRHLATERPVLRRHAGHGGRRGLELDERRSGVASGSSPPCPVGHARGRSNTRDRLTKPKRQRSPSPCSHGSGHCKTRSRVGVAAGNALDTNRFRCRDSGGCRSPCHNACRGYPFPGSIPCFAWP
jgi:hypothetical protein